MRPSFVDTGVTPTTPLDDAGLERHLQLPRDVLRTRRRGKPTVRIAGTDHRRQRADPARQPAGIPTGTGIPEYDTINIYRNLASNADQYYLVASVSPDGSYIDSRSDADISDLTDPANREIDFDGPKITNATLLTNVVRRDGLEYQPLFEVGTLEYTGRKGGNALTTKTFEITAETTVGEYLQFLALASGIQIVAARRSPNPIPNSLNRIPGESGTLNPGASITSDGRLRLVSNNGTGNAVEIPSSSFQMRVARRLDRHAQPRVSPVSRTPSDKALRPTSSCTIRWASHSMSA